MGLLEEVDERLDDVLVATVEEGGGDTGVSGTAGTTDPVDVVVDVRREVEADDVLDVRGVEPSRGDGGSDHDWGSTVLEGLDRVLALSLGAIAVDGGSGDPVLLEELLEHVGHPLGLDEDEGEAGDGHPEEEVEEDGALVLVLDVLDLLGDVLGSRTDPTDGEEHLFLLEEVESEPLDLAREGGGEHECLAVVGPGHVLLLNDPPDLGLETHIEHPVGLVEDEVADVGKGDPAALDHVDEPAGGGREEVTAGLDLSHLGADVGPSVDDGGPDPGPVGELAGFLVDLEDELAGGGEDESGRTGDSGPAAVGPSSGTSSGREVVEGGVGDRASTEELAEDGEEEAGGLAGAGLGTGHDVLAGVDDRDGELLDGGRDEVAGELDVLEQVGVDGLDGELGHSDGLGEGYPARVAGVGRGDGDWDVAVLVEVDAGVEVGGVAGLAEELLLRAGVPGCDDVLAVPPGTVAIVPV